MVDEEKQRKEGTNLTNKYLHAKLI